MAELPYTGLTASVKLGAYAVGVTIGYISGVTLNLEKDIIELLAFGMQYKEKVPAIKNWTASCDGTAAFDATGGQSQLYEAFESGAAVTIGIYLNPTTYFEGSAYIKSLKIEAAPDDKISVSMELDGNGAIIFSLVGTSDLLVFVCTDHATAGATQIAEVTPAVGGGGNSYLYRVNAGLPAVGTVLAAPWTAYVLAAAMPAINGDIITLVEIVTATKAVVHRGLAAAVVTA